MKKALAAVLLVALGVYAARRKPAPDAVDLAAIGKELATFRQVLVPLSPQLTELIVKNGVEKTSPADVAAPYLLGSVPINHRATPAFVAYTGPFVAPLNLAVQPMSIEQFLSSFGRDLRVELAVVATPKGGLVFTRDQLTDVIVAARSAGASSETMPFSVVHGLAKKAP